MPSGYICATYGILTPSLVTFRFSCLELLSFKHSRLLLTMLFFASFSLHIVSVPSFWLWHCLKVCLSHTVCAFSVLCTGSHHRPVTRPLKLRVHITSKKVRHDGSPVVGTGGSLLCLFIFTLHVPNSVWYTVWNKCWLTGVGNRRNAKHCQHFYSHLLREGSEVTPASEAP